MDENSRKLKVQDRMSRAVEVAHLHEPLTVVEARMRARDVGCLPVLDGDRLVGLITRSDVARLEAERGNLAELTARDVMPPGTFHCFERHSLAEATATMDALGIDHLVVLDDEKQLVGVLARRDLPHNAAPDHPPVGQASGEDESKEPEPGLRVYSEKPKLKY